MTSSNQPKNPTLPAELEAPILIYERPRDPTPADFASYKVRDFWINTVAQEMFVLVAKPVTGAVWKGLAAAGGGTDQFDADTGSATPSGGVIDLLGGTGFTTSAAGGAVTFDLDTPVTVPNGGTGNTSLTDGGILLGSGTGAVTTTSQPTDGQLLIGSSGGDPVLATLTSGGNLTITNTPGGIELTGVSPSGVTWENITTTVVRILAPNNGYICSNPGGSFMRLPLTAARGDTYWIAGNGSITWNLDVRTGQQVHLGNSSTTVGGAVDNTGLHDCAKIVCVVPDTEFVIMSHEGTLILS